MSILVLMQLLFGVNFVLLCALFVRTLGFERRITEELRRYAGEEVPDSIDEESLEDTDYERFAAMRERQFDERIEQMKRELSENAEARGINVRGDFGKNLPYLANGVSYENTADVLHPDVENLPHHTIPDYETNPPDVEHTV